MILRRLKSKTVDFGLIQQGPSTEKQQLEDDLDHMVIDVQTSLVKGELGYYLAAAIWWTLVESNSLGKWYAKTAHEGCPDMKIEPSYDASIWLSLGDQVWSSWSSEIVMECYERLKAHRCSSATTLNYWVRAVGGEADDFWDMHRLCVSQALMVSLVERGGNPFVALKL